MVILLEGVCALVGRADRPPKRLRFDTGLRGQPFGSEWLATDGATKKMITTRNACCLNFMNGHKQQMRVK